MEYTFTWFIENYSYCLQKTAEALKSPEFLVSELEGTAWHIELFPRGCLIRYRKFISIFLKRSKLDVGPENILLRYELSLLRADGLSVISEETQDTFKKGGGYGFVLFRNIDELLLHQKDIFLPHDTLSVRCKMWINDGEIHKVGQSFATTHIGVDHVSFSHVIAGFSMLKPNKKMTSEFIYSIEGRITKYSINTHLADSPSGDGRIILEITPNISKKILSKCNLFLLGSSGIVTKCGKADNRYDDTRKDISNLPLSLTKKEILERRKEYLPDNKLTLLCQCSFSTGVEYEKIERTLHEIPSSVLNQINNNLMTEMLSDCCSVIDDLKNLYSTQLLADVEFKTKTKSYRAHKNLLCARSPVFNAMFTYDMKEKNTAFIKVKDMDNDTVEKLLHFLYSDNIENPDWDSAFDLYYAADKYAIEKLKLMCSAILIDNLSTANATELLLLADNHNDSDLQTAVNDFIQNHEKHIYGSDEWFKLAEKNPALVCKTMLLKYTQNI